MLRKKLTTTAAATPGEPQRLGTTEPRPDRNGIAGPYGWNRPAVGQADPGAHPGPAQLDDDLQKAQESGLARVLGRQERHAGQVELNAAAPAGRPRGRGRRRRDNPATDRGADDDEAAFREPAST